MTKVVLVNEPHGPMPPRDHISCVVLPRDHLSLNSVAVWRGRTGNHL